MTLTERKHNLNDFHFHKVLSCTSVMDTNTAQRESDQLTYKKESTSYQRHQTSKVSLINLKYTDTRVRRGRTKNYLVPRARVHLDHLSGIGNYDSRPLVKEDGGSGHEIVRKLTFLLNIEGNKYFYIQSYRLARHTQYYVNH